jgi:hypothetical protein
VLRSWNEYLDSGKLPSSCGTNVYVQERWVKDAVAQILKVVADAQAEGQLRVSMTPAEAKALWQRDEPLRERLGIRLEEKWGTSPQEVAHFLEHQNAQKGALPAAWSPRRWFPSSEQGALGIEDLALLLSQKAKEIAASGHTGMRLLPRRARAPGGTSPSEIIAAVNSGRLQEDRVLMGMTAEFLGEDPRRLVEFLDQFRLVAEPT